MFSVLLADVLFPELLAFASVFVVFERTSTPLADVVLRVLPAFSATYVVLEAFSAALPDVLFPNFSCSAAATEALLIELTERLEMHSGSLHQEAGTLINGPSSVSSSSSLSPSSSSSSSSSSAASRVALAEQSPGQKQVPVREIRQPSLQRRDFPRTQKVETLHK